MNVARGGLLDYCAVKAAIEADRIGGLGLDVQWQEPVDPEDFFASHPKCASPPAPHCDAPTLAPRGSLQKQRIGGQSLDRSLDMQCSDWNMRLPKSQ